MAATPPRAALVLVVVCACLGSAGRREFRRPRAAGLGDVAHLGRGHLALASPRAASAGRVVRVQARGATAPGERPHGGEPRGHARVGRSLEVRIRTAELLRVPGAHLVRRRVQADRVRRDEPGEQSCPRLRAGRAEPDHRRAPAAPDRPHGPPGPDPDSEGRRGARGPGGLRALSVGGIAPRPGRRHAPREESAAPRRRGGGAPARRCRGLGQAPHPAKHGVRVRREPGPAEGVRTRRGARGRRPRAGLRAARRPGHRALPGAPDRLLARELPRVPHARHRGRALPQRHSHRPTVEVRPRRRGPMVVGAARFRRGAAPRSEPAPPPGSWRGLSREDFGPAAFPMRPGGRLGGPIE